LCSPQLRGLQLEPDEKQHHDDAEFGDVHDFRYLAREAEYARTNHHSGGEIAEHRAQAEAREQRRCDDGRREVDEDAG